MASYPFFTCRHFPFTHTAAATPGLLAFLQTHTGQALWPDTCFFPCLEYPFLWSPQGSSFTSSRSFLKSHLRDVSPVPSPFKTALSYVSSLQLNSNSTCCFTFLHGILIPGNIEFILLSRPSPASSMRMEAQGGQWLCLSCSDKRPVSPTFGMVLNI